MHFIQYKYDGCSTDRGQQRDRVISILHLLSIPPGHQLRSKPAPDCTAYNSLSCMACMYAGTNAGGGRELSGEKWSKKQQQQQPVMHAWPA